LREQLALVTPYFSGMSARSLLQDTPAGLLELLPALLEGTAAGIAIDGMIILGGLPHIAHVTIPQRLRQSLLDGGRK
jgi:hypothetical protein